MSALAFEMPGCAKNRKVVAFGSTAGKDDLARLAGPNARDPVPRVVEQRAGLPSHMVEAGRVAVNLAKVGQHRVAHLRREWRGRVVIEINRAHNGKRSGKTVLGPGVGRVRIAAQFPKPKDVTVEERDFANELCA